MVSEPQTRAGTAATAGELQPAPSTHRYVHAGAVKLHYLDYGTAGRPTMLCIHGSAANGHWFDFVAPGLTQDYRVLALDLRGHGDSDPVDPPSYTYADYAADIDKVVKALDLKDFVLAGHSMGGTVSLLYAATYPGRAKALIVVDSTVNLSADRINKMRDIGSRGGKSYATREELVSRYRLRPGNSLAAPEVVRHIASNSCREVEDGWRHKFDRSVYATREVFDGTPLWSDIKIPTLLVKGDRSERITPEVYAEVKARCPQAALVEVSDTDHHVTLDNPLGFLAAVQPFLAKHR
jgi:pimeloyl-ACP methyl ester carboxylesterase